MSAIFQALGLLTKAVFTTVVAAIAVTVTRNFFSEEESRRQNAYGGQIRNGGWEHYPSSGYWDPSSVRASPARSTLPTRSAPLPTRSAPPPTRAQPSIKQSSSSKLVPGCALEDVIHDITGWNPEWLKQVDEPPVESILNSVDEVREVQSSFTSYEDYVKILTPLILLNLWSSIKREYDSDPNNPRKVTVGIDSGEIRSYVTSTNRQLMNIFCHAALTEEQFKDALHPRVGDLVCLDVVYENENKTVPIFAYVKSHNKMVLTPKTSLHAKILEISQFTSASFKISFVLQTKFRPNAVNTACAMGMKVVSYINSELRLFDALSSLPSSPLYGHIMKPTLHNFSLPALWQFRFVSSINQEFLNESQKRVVAQTALGCLKPEPTICMIQGPPGTGKSRVVVNLIMQILYLQKEDRRFAFLQKSPKILLCAPSNAAVDELVIRLLEAQKNIKEENRFLMVRTGRTETMNPQVKHVSLLELGKRQLSFNADPKKQARMEWDAQERIIREADIVATTLSSCYNYQMEKIYKANKSSIQFTCCIIDEATQSHELETLIPLMLGVPTLVLVGDDKQLPATVLNKVAKKKGLDQSLFARLKDQLTDSGINPIQILKTQYRMHPEICLWPNGYFYNNQLLSAPDLAQLRASPLMPYSILGLDFRQTEHGELTNVGEAVLVSHLVLGILKALKNKELSIGIITPYQQQKSEILSFLSKHHPSLQNVDVNTIDSFQGQERDIIVMSCVRTQGVGFLSDTHRLNVALTRARQSLLLCGNFFSLRKHKMWEALLNDASEREVLQHVPSWIANNEIELVKLVLRDKENIAVLLPQQLNNSNSYMMSSNSGDRKKKNRKKKKK